MHIVLPERLQVSQADALLGELKTAAVSSEALELDGSQVSKIDTAGLQLLVALTKTAPAWSWRAASPALVEAGRLLGLSELLKLGGTSQK
jgi:ABC-type transporter Mla MlaB component